VMLTLNFIVPWGLPRLGIRHGKRRKKK